MLLCVAAIEARHGCLVLVLVLVAVSVDVEMYHVPCCQGRGVSGGRGSHGAPRQGSHLPCS